jgi:hypothetical protein
MAEHAAIKPTSKALLVGSINERFHSRSSSAVYRQEACTRPESRIAEKPGPGTLDVLQNSLNFLGSAFSVRASTRNPS